jgi:hypothetical protein
MAGLHDPLATCKSCGGLICSVHGTRYTEFECAVCNPGKAVKTGFFPDHDPAGAAAAAHLRELALIFAGPEPPGADAVVDRILSEQEAGPSAGERRGLAGRHPPANLVYGLATVIRESMGPGSRDLGGGEAQQVRWVPKVRGADRAEDSGADPLAGLSIDAIGAAVAATFSDVEVSPTPDAGLIVHGAALRALAVADAEVAELFRASEPGVEIPIKAPWEVTHPVLLDPIMWMILTGYQQ